MRTQKQVRLKGGSLLNLEAINTVAAIDKAAAREVLIDSFVTEYRQYLKPEDIDARLTSWDEGIRSVRQYYANYFDSECYEFAKGQLDFWVEAKLGDRLVGWATFVREKGNPEAVYMNLLIVSPEDQRKGIGEQLVKSLMTLGLTKKCPSIHLLLRKANQAGRQFYSKLGFHYDASYKRDGNFVDISLLEPWTWHNPELQLKQTPSSHSLFGFVLNQPVLTAGYVGLCVGVVLVATSFALSSSLSLSLGLGSLLIGSGLSFFHGFCNPTVSSVSDSTQLNMAHV